jgi:hypothetical protein
LGEPDAFSAADLVFLATASWRSLSRTGGEEISQHLSIPVNLSGFCAALPGQAPGGELLMLRAIVAVLLILWLLGFVLHIAGGVIHVLAVIAVAVLIYDLVTRKRAAS